MSFERDVELLTTEAALCEPPPASRLEVMGPDGERFFGGMVTAAVEGLEPGTGCFGFITDVRGRILASATVLALEDRLWLEIPKGRGRTIIEHLEKYIVTDQVEILPLGDMASVRIAGPKSAEALADLGASAARDLTEPWSHTQVEFLDYQARLVREGNSATPAYSLWQSSAIAPLMADDLAEAGLQRVGREATEALRIEHGYPLWGVDYDDANLPQETGIEDAVDYEKGCYLGQEIVARIHYRGQPARRMCRLVFESGHLPAAGAEIEFDGRSAGTVSSVSPSPRDDAAIGLALLPRRAVEALPQARVRIEGRATRFEALAPET
ncbi:MAG: folate-binding protein YgfZ [Holophagales bacterium]|nr:folate-binding protein YgfZ [Holophagales bacterium]MYF03909.1 folate-binding protein YgfZ [Holophagales bacterium]MYJ24217.1 folate-binding protein YgfZ [Holophagales bacterium]